MEFRVLGPLEVVDGARPVPINGAKQRALLTILLLHANQTVSSGRLLEELWGDEQPESGLTALQVRVSQLRKALGKGGASIVTKPAGYALELGANELDLRQFEELVADADRALQRDAPEQAWAQLQRALALWHGPRSRISPMNPSQARRLRDSRSCESSRMSCGSTQGCVSGGRRSSSPSSSR